ncbi:hypothetical protein NKR23_g5815 [Pleurostoma richardsiae]|uniref:Glyoxalase/fosfomycin resistance/dioxygenase domain-containing protein n=1 Tax=Pleurostoma richardsiae TaxID=41990 RepID=A0AA38RCP6_9PEZI|nr:hypothetical protein NKR23_g5815 [Pleurostoma richardsiae]
MSIAHISLSTGPKNFETVRAFYLAILKPLGYTVYKEHAPDYCGLMTRKGADFWLHGGNKDISLADSSDLDSRESNFHVAFNADSRKVVDEWYETAIKAGGIPNGPPGERAYAKGYYAAFVLDPVGNNIEAVHWSPPVGEDA